MSQVIINKDHESKPCVLDCTLDVFVMFPFDSVPRYEFEITLICSPPRDRITTFSSNVEHTISKLTTVLYVESIRICIL